MIQANHLIKAISLLFSLYTTLSISLAVPSPRATATTWHCRPFAAPPEATTTLAQPQADRHKIRARLGLNARCLSLADPPSRWSAISSTSVRPRVVDPSRASTTASPLFLALLKFYLLPRGRKGLVPRGYPWNKPKKCHFQRFLLEIPS